MTRNPAAIRRDSRFVRFSRKRSEPKSGTERGGGESLLPRGEFTSVHACPAGSSRNQIGGLVFYTARFILPVMKRIGNKMCSGLALWSKALACGALPPACCSTGLALAGLALQAFAATSDDGRNPYQVVVERNVFDLRAPPPVIETKEAPPTPPAKLTLQGITEFLGKRQVLLKILEQPKPGEQPKERALIMDEGERRGIVTVLEINPKTRSVKFDNGGIPQTLELTNAPTKLAGPMPGAVPGQMPLPVMPQPGVSAVPPPAVLPAMAAVPNYTGGRTAANLPARTVRTGTISAPIPTVGAPNQPQRPQLTPEEQIILMEVERERTKEATARGELPPLPPTELTPPGSAGMPPSPPVPVP